MLSSIVDYSYFVYTIPDRFPSVKRSTLVLKPMGISIGELEGRLTFSEGIALRAYEIIDFEQGAITYYSYTVYQGSKRLYWYDPQPHPDDPTLASTHPHHKHTPPDIKHNRVPAPGLSFDHPNLSILIHEVEETLLNSSAPAP